MPIVVVDTEPQRGLTITKEKLLPKENIFTINERISDTEFYDQSILGGSIGGYTKSDLKGFNKRIKKRRKKNKNKKTHRRK